MSKAREILNFLSEDREEIIRQVRSFMESQGYKVQYEINTLIEFQANAAVDFESLHFSAKKIWPQTSDIETRHKPEPSRRVFVVSPMTSVTFTISHVPEAKIVSVDITA